MVRLLKAVVLIVLVYVVPLVGAPQLILSYKILILCVAGAVLLLSQPDISTKDATMMDSMDRRSVTILLVAGLISHMLPVVEWAYVGTGAKGTDHVVVTLAGLAMIAAGLGIRVWAIRTLGRFFTSTVQIVDGHRVVKHGPYALARHPSYLGAYLAIVGSAVVLNTVAGTIVAAALMLGAYTYRVRVEERALVEAFGDEYREYQRQTARIIPLIW